MKGRTIWIVEVVGEGDHAVMAAYEHEEDARAYANQLGTRGEALRKKLGPPMRVTYRPLEVFGRFYPSQVPYEGDIDLPGLRRHLQKQSLGSTFGRR